MNKPAVSSMITWVEVPRKGPRKGAEPVLHLVEYQALVDSRGFIVAVYDENHGYLGALFEPTEEDIGAFLSKLYLGWALEEESPSYDPQFEVLLRPRLLYYKPPLEESHVSTLRKQSRVREDVLLVSLRWLLPEYLTYEFQVNIERLIPA